MSQGKRRSSLAPSLITTAALLVACWCIPQRADAMPANWAKIRKLPSAIAHRGGLALQKLSPLLHPLKTLLAKRPKRESTAGANMTRLPRAPENLHEWQTTVAELAAHSSCGGFGDIGRTLKIRHAIEQLIVAEALGTLGPSDATSLRTRLEKQLSRIEF